MALREIVHIDEDLCDGCGDCVPACAEGAIQIIDGKARLLADRLCDGMGACLGHCPKDAITVERREAEEFDEGEVEKHLGKIPAGPAPLQSVRMAPPPGGCPGSQLRQMTPQLQSQTGAGPGSQRSALGQWPVQLTLVPPHAPFLKGADLLICADCVPFAVPDFHQRYLAGRAVLVGCPKLDNLQAYYEKLIEIFAVAKPSRITVLKMEVPCCGGIAQAATLARSKSAPDTPLEVHTIAINSTITCQPIAPEPARSSHSS